VERIRRRPGHYAKAGEPVVDIRIGTQIFQLCAVEAGKVMRCREVGEIVHAGDEVIEITSVGSPTWEMFVAHRHSDSPGHAGHVADYLRRELGPGQVFRDIESLPKGPDYVEIIRARLQTAVVMVVIIGPRWFDLRLHDFDDLHREEIRTALQRGIHVQPVFVGGATMPRQGGWGVMDVLRFRGRRRLPKDLVPLATKNGIEVSDARWDYDMGLVLAAVEVTLDQSPRRRAFLAQLPPWIPGPRLQFVEDNPPLDENS